ncbi:MULTISPECIES: glycosyltransferase family 87 protein [Legionella]|uniref:Mannosyltransferase n=1 Tax=Legionella drozanskii LLAP-1 TaxID=1212489 RepID=A0A0W0SV62_9GAMM|nr:MULTISPECIES: glycosyltransferase family 87 protein [Legionella]KTC87259.1 hypothetical protein Ldro_0878 [Legionella drozanskii LLAP-1]PJE17891.1 MAG: DUF2029 domain-containing protein [Legionella sp.]
MNSRYLPTAFISILLIAYYLIFYFLLNHPNQLDFTSFYAALVSLKNHENPYGVLWSHFLPVAKELTPNLNPPALLWIFSPLVKLNYYAALLLWIAFSFTLGLLGAGLAFYYAFSFNFLKKYWLLLLLFYLSFFPTMVNTILVQVGSFLLFFIMIGYYFFLRDRSFLAGFIWGFVVAIKLFPALIFFYVIKQGRSSVFFIMLASFLVFSLMPFVSYGTDIYLAYFAVMKRVFWYGDNWNASIYGYIFRLFGYHDKHYLELGYLVLFFSFLGGYFYNLQPNQTTEVNHQPFSLTLTMMLLISPFGWLYYFPILIFPLALGWAIATNEIKSTKKTILLWLLCFFLINVPQSYVTTNAMQNFAVSFIFSSFYFYGLLLLNYFFVLKKQLPGKNDFNHGQENSIFILIVFFISLFGLITTTLKLTLTVHTSLLAAS